MMMLLSLLLACGEKDTPEDPAARACEENGQGDTVAASSDVDGAPLLNPDVGANVDLSGVTVGFLGLSVPADGAWLLFVNREAVVTGLWKDGEQQTLPPPSPNEDCPTEIPEHYDLELTAGTWTVQVGPAAVDSAWMLFTEAGEHGH